MAKRMIDYKVDEVTNDLVIGAGGDFVQVESTAQHQKQLILCNTGEYKQSPTICVGAMKYMDGEGFNALINKVSSEFTRDGMDVQRVALLPDGTIQADAFYK